MKNILFCRVSSKEQEDTGYSLDAQEKLLKEYSEKRGFETIKIFKVSESASGKMVRKLFMEMFAYADKHKIPIICCEKIDRLTRNLKDASLVQDWIEQDKNREVHFLKESFILNGNTKAHENLVWDMKVAIARFYTNNLSEEVKKGQKEKISQGWLPTKPPLGYKTIGEKGHKTHIPDEKAPFIIKMFELYSTGNYSTPALVETMYKEGLRGRNNKKVGKSRLYDLLSDPFYCGQVRWNNQIYPGKQESIITKDLYDLVQEKLNRKIKVPRYQKHNPVFKAKIDCSECGGTITWEIQKGHWYGHCNHYKKCSQNTWWKQEQVEEILFPMFNNVAPKSDRILEILQKALKEHHSCEIEYNTFQLKDLNRRFDIAQRRLETIYEDKIDGKITQEFYDRKFQEYTKEKEEVTGLLKKLDEGNSKYYEVGFAIHELASKASEIYRSPKSSIEDRKLLLSKIFSNLSLEADNIRPNYTLAFEFLTKWSPILNDTFEPEKNVDNKGQKSTFVLSHPVLLRSVDVFRTLNWNSIKQELDFSGVLDLFPEETYSS
jgi:DNA invertase Pin-like site-specific DNA recombinase